MLRSFAILIAALIAIPSFSQTGPHNAASPIVYRAISSDGKRMMTASWYDVAVWNLDDYSLIRSFTIESIGLPLSDDYKFASDPEMKVVWLKAFSKANAAVVDIDKWEYFAAPNENLGFISSNHKGVSWSPAKETDIVDLKTGDIYRIKEFHDGGNPSMSPDGTMISSSFGKKSKTYNFITGKVTSGYFSKEEKKDESRHSYEVSFPDVNSFILKPPGTTFKLAVGSTPSSPPEWPRIINIEQARGRLSILENSNKYDGTREYQHHAVFYSLPSGQVIKDLPLNGSAEEAKKLYEKEQKAYKEKLAAEAAARQAKLANARPGYKEFDSKFTTLNSPYTLDYNSAQGFSLVSDSFINGDMGLRSGSEINGLGKICTCESGTSYLLMVRNRTQSNDLSNFIIVSYEVDGTRLGSQTIGATQKDLSGITKLDFTISVTGCRVEIKAASTSPNGHKEDKSFSFVQCNVSVK